MSVEKAKPGDTIVCVKPESTHYGREFLVVECPDNDKSATDVNGVRYVDRTWVNYGGDVFFVTDEYYKIVNHNNKCQSVNDVDAFLSNQLDANLRSVFT